MSPQGSTTQKTTILNPVNAARDGGSSDLADLTARDFLELILLNQRRTVMILIALLNELSNKDGAGFTLTDFDDDFTNEYPD